MNERLIKHQSTDRVVGLDSIRFICAIIVVMGHGMKPPLADGLSKETFIGLALRGIYNNLWNGPAAVIVFFVISGFCIHYPNSLAGKIPNLRSFYTRRVVRIVIPTIATVLLSKQCGVVLSILDRSILWSLIAEILYYLTYPLLLRLRGYSGSWLPLIVTTYIVAFGIAASRPTSGDYPSFGTALNTLLGLPCWLLGCRLAEKVAAQKNGDTAESRDVPTQSSLPSGAVIWGFRILIVATAWTCSVVRFHSPIGYPWTLNLFAILVSLWLLREICWFRSRGPSAIVEQAGTWSFSLYLTHPAAMQIAGHAKINGLFPPFHDAPLFSVLAWLFAFSFILLFAYIFYWFVERPSHTLARWLSSKSTSER